MLFAELGRNCMFRKERKYNVSCVNCAMQSSPSSKGEYHYNFVTFFVCAFCMYVHRSLKTRGKKSIGWLYRSGSGYMERANHNFLESIRNADLDIELHIRNIRIRIY